MESALNFIWLIINSVLSSLIDIKEFILGYIKEVFDKFYEYLHHVSDFISWLYDLIIAFPPWLFDLVKALFLAFWDFLTDLFSWGFSEILGLVVYILSNIPGLDSLDSVSDILSSIPSDILSIMGLIGIPECTALIVAALGIRLFLQLVPFTRLGS